MTTLFHTMLLADTNIRDMVMQKYDCVSTFINRRQSLYVCPPFYINDCCGSVSLCMAYNMHTMCVNCPVGLHLNGGTNSSHGSLYPVHAVIGTVTAIFISPTLSR